MSVHEMPAAIDPSKPIAGFYKTRLARNGPWVPAEIVYLEDAFDLPVWHIKLGTGDEITDQIEVLEMWPYLAKHPIDQASYDYMLADQAHAAEHRPLDAKATPTRPVDWTGHNMPPSDDLIKAERLIERADSAGRVATIDDAHVAIDLVKQMTVLAKRLDDARKEAAAPHKQAQAEAELPYKTRLTPMGVAKTKLLYALHAWRTRAGLARITTDLGATVYPRTAYRVKITDPSAIPRAYCAPNEDAISVALRNGAEVPGAELEEQTTTVVS